ncbi:hypothetical protein QJQ45_018203, partial [Haematococcus lacustris]
MLPLCVPPGCMMATSEGDSSSTLIAQDTSPPAGPSRGGAAAGVRAPPGPGLLRPEYDLEEAQFSDDDEWDELDLELQLQGLSPAGEPGPGLDSSGALGGGEEGGGEGLGGGAFLEVGPASGTEVVFVREGVAVWPERRERIQGRLSLIKQHHVLFLAWLPYGHGRLEEDGSFTPLPGARGQLAGTQG